MPLEESMPTHPSILAWRIPWTKEPGGPQSMGLHRVRHNWSNLACCSCISSLNWILLALLCGRIGYSHLTFREVKWRTSNPSCLTELLEQMKNYSALQSIFYIAVMTVFFKSWNLTTWLLCLNLFNDFPLLLKQSPKSLPYSPRSSLLILLLSFGE